MKKNEKRFAGQICDSCNHDIECEDCASFSCFRRACPIKFDDCREILEPFIAELYYIMEMRESKFPWWHEGLTPAEMRGIIIYDRISKTVQAEHLMNKNNNET